MNQGRIPQLLTEIEDAPSVVIRSGYPLLHIAILTGQVEILHAFLRHGANPNKPDRYGQHPIFLTVETGKDIRLLDLLIQYQAGIDLTDRHGASPLMYAAGHSLLPQSTSLLKAGANPNFRDNEGDTALMYAIGTNHLPLISLLLAYGADPYLPNFDGLTAIDKATNQDIRSMILPG